MCEGVGPVGVGAGAVGPERDVPMSSHYDMRWVLGDLPFRPGPGARAHVGGWIRLVGDVAVDEVVLPAMSDAWLPPIFSRLALPLAERAAAIAAEHRFSGGDSLYFAVAVTLSDRLVTLDPDQLARGNALVETTRPRPM